MTSVSSSNVNVRQNPVVEPKSEERNQANTTAQSVAARTVEHGGPRFVSRGYFKGEQVKEQSLLGKLRQKLGQPTQLAVHRSKGSGALFATGVSSTRFAKMKLQAPNERQANLKAAESVLKTAQINIPGMSADQKVRLAILVASRPELASKVVARAEGKTDKLNSLLETAELVEGKRSRLTNDESEGGLGIKKLVRGDSLGSGNFGEVRIYKDPDSNRQFAGKVLKNANIESLMLFEKEEEILARLPEHNNLVKSYGIHTINGEDVLLQEFVSGGSLKDVLAKLDWKNLTPAEKQIAFKHIASQVFQALEQLQKLGIVHADVRAENLLFDLTTCEIKLTDFGIAKDRGEIGEEQFPWAWAPPEVYDEKDRKLSFRDDTYSTSRVLVGELVPHTNIFNVSVRNLPVYAIAESKSEQQGYIQKATQEGGLPSSLHQATVDLLEEIDNTGELASFVDAISKPNKEGRLRANEALEHKFLENLPAPQDIKQVFSKLNASDVPTTQTANAYQHSPVIPVNHGNTYSATSFESDATNAYSMTPEESDVTNAYSTTPDDTDKTNAYSKTPDDADKINAYSITPSDTEKTSAYSFTPGDTDT